MRNMSYIHLQLGFVYKNPSLEPSIGGFNVDGFFTQFAERANHTALFGSEYGPPTYDAVWAMALALNRTWQKMQQTGTHLFPLFPNATIPSLNV